jgi:hypothetical protein
MLPSRIQNLLDEALAGTEHRIVLNKLGVMTDAFGEASGECLYYCATCTSPEFVASGDDDELVIDEEHGKAVSILKTCNERLWSVGLCIEMESDDIAEDANDNSFSCFVNVGLLTRNMPESIRMEFIGQQTFLYGIKD